MVLGGITSESRGAVGVVAPIGDLVMGAFNITFTSGYLGYTDIPMLDYKCGVCGKEFKEGEDITLRIRKIKVLEKTERPLVLAVPIHRGKCSLKKGLKWTLKMEDKK